MCRFGSRLQTASLQIDKKKYFIHGLIKSCLFSRQNAQGHHLLISGNSWTACMYLLSPIATDPVQYDLALSNTRIWFRAPESDCPPVNKWVISSRVEHSHWSRSVQILCSDWSGLKWCFASSLMPSRTAQGNQSTYWEHFLPFAESLWHKGGFQAQKESIIGLS